MKQGIQLVLFTMILAGLLLARAAAEMRTWTSRSGRQVEAEWVGEEDGLLILRRADGRRLGIECSALSETDQEYLEGLRAAAPEVATPGPGPADESARAPASLTLGGVEIRPGELIRFHAPLPSDAVRELDKEKNTVVTNAKIGIAVPAGFDPAKPWNIIVISATSDANALSIGHAGQYLDAILGRNWVVMAADGPNDDAPIEVSNTWRWSLIRAGLEELHRRWPASRQWNYATGGFSGGAKRSGYIAALLAASAYKVIGMFMGGCNEDMATRGIDQYKPSRWTFLKVPIFLSNGEGDNVATVEAGRRVRDSMNDRGFKNIRVETCPGGHDPYPAHMSEALAWFEETEAPRTP